MSDAFQAWAAITLSALCVRNIDPGATPSDFPFAILAVCWSVAAALFALRALLRILERAL